MSQEQMMNSSSALPLPSSNLQLANYQTVTPDESSNAIAAAAAGTHANSQNLSSGALLLGVAENGLSSSAIVENSALTAASATQRNQTGYTQRSTPRAQGVVGANTSNPALLQQQNSQNPQQSQSQNQQQHASRHHSSRHGASSTSSSNIVGVHYKVGRKIGEGSFGVIYEGINLLNHAPIAIKFEPRKSDAPQLRDEFRTYKIMNGTIGVPTAYYFGQEGLHNILCIDLLGPSMEDMFDLCSRKFSIKTVCMAAKQMISRVQSIHERNLIYRDIKPDNFLIGRLPKGDDARVDILSVHKPNNPHPSSQVYIVDFGMAKQYRDPKTKQHIPYREKKSLSGTARYMSINTHLGREQSRRDDLEALGHVFMYFLRGSLPWQGLKAATNKQKYEKIGEKKQTTAIKELCDGFPEEFSIYLSYVRSLKFEEQPDYDYMRGLFNKVLQKRDQVDDGVFDWMYIMDKQRREKERQREEARIQREKEDAARQAQAEYEAYRSAHPEQYGGGGVSHSGYDPLSSVGVTDSQNSNHNLSPHVTNQYGTSMNHGSMHAMPGTVIGISPLSNSRESVGKVNPTRSGGGGGEDHHLQQQQRISTNNNVGNNRQSALSPVASNSGTRPSNTHNSQNGHHLHHHNQQQQQQQQQQHVQSPHPTTNTSPLAVNPPVSQPKKKVKWWKKLFSCFAKDE